MYEAQIFSAGREKKIFSVEAHVSVPNKEDNPLELYPYSRFIVVLVDKTKGDTIVPSANIPVGDVPLIKALTDYALTVKMSGTTNPGNDEEEYLAYRVAFMFGADKGKTPAAVLLENPANKKRLLESKSFYQGNLEKYPANKAIIAAIDDAIQLLDEGKLDKKATSNSGNVITIYRQDYKYLKTRKDKEGRFFTYSILMTCDTSKQYSWEVTIENGFATLATNAIGSNVIDTSSVVNKKKSSMRFTDNEFYGFIDRMHSVSKDFVSATFLKQYELADSIRKRNMESGK